MSAPAKTLVALPGVSRPFGATFTGDGVNFALVSSSARSVWLALFDSIESDKPFQEIWLNPVEHRKGDVWTAYIRGLESNALYMYRVSVEHPHLAGRACDPSRYLLDPYARCMVGDVASGRGKCMVAGGEQSRTEPERPAIAMTDTVVYETHVRGFTRHESSGVAKPGTYLGVIEKIPHLKALGVTAVQVMPVQQCGEVELERLNPDTGHRLRNYWGYQPVGFFAPEKWYASEGGRGEQRAEFRAMVDALHEAGIEVILDVVFNHTAEGGVKGTTLCYRGIDNELYYHVDKHGVYKDFTGCGNTVNCNHPVVHELVVDSLRHWVTEFGVDGFRFDLASVLNRDRSGHLHRSAALVESIAHDPILKRVKLIAEAWDLAGAYQVGGFGEGRWAELNGRYRDDVRRYWRGDAGMKSQFALRLTGSPDLYGGEGRTPSHCVNLITSHDGFTLADLVSYSKKHNHGNGEGNRDGDNENYSFNCGVEGIADSIEIRNLRLQMQKNFLATLFVSLGTPFLLGGDEFGRTQRGNNNAYCQDNEISWYDWRFAEKNLELLSFCRKIARFRRENPAFRRAAFFTGQPLGRRMKPDILWFNENGKTLEWNAKEPTLTYWMNGEENDGADLYLMFNPTAEPVTFVIPAGEWLVRVNTAAVGPLDCPERGEAPSTGKQTAMEVAGRSMIVLST